MAAKHDRASFDLTERPWLPALMKDGTIRELSLMDAFAHAHDITGFDDRTSVGPFAFTRLMEAILYGVHGHSFTIHDWTRMLHDGPDMPHITAYLHERRHRFDLFDPDTPFYQCAGLRSTGRQQTFSLTRLDIANEARPARHTDGTMTAGEAARLLVTAQAYNFSGIKTGVTNGGGTKPIGAGWTGGIGGLLLEGPDLWATLMLNLVGDTVLGQGDPDTAWADDRPVWDRDQPGPMPTPGYTMTTADEGDPTSLHGPATLYTWQSRRILLHHDGETVTGCIVANGDRTRPDNAMAYEPMTAWRRNPTREKTLKRKPIYTPAKHSPDRALWRGLPAILASRKTDGIGPYTLRWLAMTGYEEPIRLHAYGLAYGTQDSVVDTAIDDTVDAPVANLTATDPMWADMIMDAVTLADTGATTIADLATDISHAAGTDGEGDRTLARRDAYTTLDTAFRQWFAQSYDSVDTAYDTWVDTVHRTLTRLADRIERDAPIHAMIGREVTEGKGDRKRTIYLTAALAGIRCHARLKKILGKDQQ